MKKIALISDSHSFIDEKTLSHLQDVDEIWHAGDIGDFQVMESLPMEKELRVVYGNIDDENARNLYPEWLDFEVEGVKVLMTHIGGKPPRYAKGVVPALKKFQPNIFVCGHSHICKVEFDKRFDCLYMNPGAIGNQGFHQMRTLLKFEIENGKPQNLRVIELGRRGV
ncbi:metallophosphoesterase family protein [Echinicola jeungdonensis]|uniref:Phosphoesterase n=1 Tax=Echinicola jeungdonensis TaxID=709343 RepID=A0ABV5J054_9BACT|nr:metallophosphoesterase family protein [Echinicola jeungdonensis]MDN3671189.1 metallophosphoesterase family protein [Echinicola jeungdonensis]